MNTLVGAPTSPRVPPLEHALVAMVGDTALVLCASKGIITDMEELGAGRNLDDGGPPIPEAPGLWIWEGRLIWRKSSSYFEPDDYDVDYKGEYRRATQEEANKLLAGEPLWPEDIAEENAEREAEADATDRAIDEYRKLTGTEEG